MPPIVDSTSWLSTTATTIADGMIGPTPRNPAILLGQVPPPEELSPRAREVWRRLGPLVDRRVQCIASDVIGFRITCEVVALSEIARECGDPDADACDRAARDALAEFYLAPAEGGGRA